jgi:hypothetical protein
MYFKLDGLPGTSREAMALQSGLQCLQIEGAEMD